MSARRKSRARTLPCIYLVDSGGANLPHCPMCFPDLITWAIFYNQATLSGKASRRSRS